MSAFNDQRIAVMERQFAVYWLQQGRSPDTSAIRLMAQAIESEVPGWIDPESLGQIIPAMRAQSKALPSVSGIIAEARGQAAERSKTALPTPESATWSTHEPGMDKWEETATLRLCAMSGFAFPEPSEFAVRAASVDPTREEAAAFCRIVANQPDPNKRAELSRRWGGRSPYFVTTNDIRKHFPRLRDAEDALF